nr:hypothetical protein [Halorubellus salinus]
MFRAAAEAATSRSDDVRAVRWDSPAVQAFLEAQFDDRPFAFLLVEDDAVYVGEAAVERIVARTGVADSVVEGLRRAYATGGGVFGRVLHGRTIADLDGTFPLTADAAAHLEDLREVREIPVRDGRTDA